jgi:hypothetical protein
MLPLGLSAAQRATFDTDGFVKVVGVWPRAEALALRAELLARLGGGLEALDAGRHKLGARLAAGGLSGSVAYANGSRGIDPENIAGLQFVQGSNLLGDDWLAYTRAVLPFRLTPARFLIQGIPRWGRLP